MRKKWSALVLALTVTMLAGLFGFSDHAFADVHSEKYPGDTVVQNPYPDVISDEEIANQIKEEEKKAGGWPGADAFMCKFLFYGNDGSVTPFNPYWVPERIFEGKGGGRIRAYLVIFGKLKDSPTMPYPCGFSINMDLSEYADDNGNLGFKLFPPDNSERRLIKFSAYLNGEKVFNETDVEPIIDFKQISETQYLMFESEELPDFFAMMGIRMGKEWGRGGRWADVARVMMQTVESESATFHMVDDFAYRRALGLSSDAVLEGRLSDVSRDNKYPARPVLKRPGMDHEGVEFASHTTYGGLTEYDADPQYLFRSAMVLPVGAPQGGMLSGLWYEADPATGLPTQTLRKSFEEIRDIPDSDMYVYVDTDLDKPLGSSTYAIDTTTAEGKALMNKRGAHIMSTAIDGNGVYYRDRHYYLTYRPLPNAVTFIKHDATDEKNVLKDAEFSLYRVASVGDEGDVLIKEGLKTNAEGKIVLAAPKLRDELRALVVDDLRADVKKSVYFDGDSIYLPAGEYYLVETKAPHGFLPNRKVSFTLDNPTFEGETQVEVSVKVPNAPFPGAFRLTKTGGAYEEDRVLLPGATYKLMRLSEDGTEYKEIKAGLVTDEKGTLLSGALSAAELKKMADDVSAKLADPSAEGHDAAVANQEAGFYEYEGNLYLAPGKYQLIETDAPMGYVLDETPISFTIEKNSAEKPLFDAEGNLIPVELKANNTPIPSNLFVMKTDEKTGEGLKGAEFSLYYVAKDKEILVAEKLVSDEQGEIHLGAAKTFDELYELAKANPAKAGENWITTEDGTYLFPGTYVLRETGAPENYVVGQDTFFEVMVMNLISERDTTTVYLDIANKKAPELQNIKVTKKWSGFEGAEEITVELLRDGESVATAKLNKENQWTHTFEGLRKADDNDKAYEYTLVEVGAYEGRINLDDKTFEVTVSGNASEGFVVTNRYMPVVSNIYVKKLWENGQGGEVVVELLCDGKVVAEAKLNEKNQWIHVFTYLRITDESGREHVYTVREKGEKNGVVVVGSKEFTVKVSGNVKDGFVIQNTLKPSPEKPVKPTPEKPVNPTPKKPEQPKNPAKPKKPQAPKTGDAILLTMGVMAAAGAGYAAISKKKRDEE